MKPFAYLVERHLDGRPFLELLGFLASGGLHLERPGTIEVVEWNSTGDRLLTSRDSFINKFDPAVHLTFDLWFSDGVSLGCSFRPLDALTFGFGFDLWGLDSDEQAVVTHLALSRFRELAACSQAVLVVVDGTGATSDFDWRDFVYRAGEPPTWPDTIGLEAVRVPDVRESLAAYDLEHIGDCVLFSRRADSCG